MPAVLVLLLIAVPFIELVVFIQVAGWLGPLDALAAVILLGLAGGWLVKREGLGVWRRAQARLNAGEVPAAEAVNGLLLLLAGLLLLVPGFLSDIVGLLLLVPPVRAALRALLFRRFERRVRTAFAGSGRVVMDGAAAGRRRVRTGPATYGPIRDVSEVTGGGASAPPRPEGSRPSGRP